MTKNKDVQILMSTYNGEQYLREQLDSIVALEGFDRICVLIRDDGSTDHTRQILHDYENQYGFEVLYETNIGVNASIYRLLEKSSANCRYFAICDQDDVWLPNKMKIALAALSQEPINLPCLFASLSDIVDSNLRHLGYSVYPKRGATYYNALIQNIAAGHTQVFNSSMKKLLLDANIESAHVVDWWIYLTASAFGKVIFYPKCTVLHRQHGNNAVGYSLHPWAKFIKRLRWIFTGKGNAISKQILSFYTSYKEFLPPEYRKETERYLKFGNNLFTRIYYALTCKVYRQQPLENILFKLLYVIGKYKLGNGKCLRSGEI